MACLQADPNQTDRLSILPDELLITVLSFLPTRMAARTSVLCRRFRHLWEASPSVQLVGIYNSHKFIAMADRVLLHRNPSHALLTLQLELSYLRSSLPDSYVPSLLAQAHSLRLRHLTVQAPSNRLVSILPSIFSIDSLWSLSLQLSSYPLIKPYHIFPSGFTLTCLKSLSLQLYGVDSAVQLNQLLSQLCSLEDLQLETNAIDKLSLSSRTIRTLKLIIGSDAIQDIVELFLPSLESFHFQHENSEFLSGMCRIHGQVPLLKNAVIRLYNLHAEDVGAVMKLLSFISHVEQLTLRLKESVDEKYPIPILLEPGKDVPNFPNLKHLIVGLCFHVHNFQAVIMMLHNGTALESLKLVHEIPKFTGLAKGRNRKDWGSRLPRNADGNYRYAYFRNLHLGEHKKEFMKLLGMKCSS
ncbi:hypothetical protein LUZ61_013346 [Rhynchospora tenuis]|uniref:F-box domain-containing protein n=1 Tax=Rhynchospora tenuis TaxID=198213 RepID=A0AAD5W8U4_9POAL|nr:hypothetical protein LUZ61_013346 [Rhynchospora tenuis]